MVRVYAGEERDQRAAYQLSGSCARSGSADLQLCGTSGGSGCGGAGAGSAALGAPEKGRLCAAFAARHELLGLEADKDIPLDDHPEMSPFCKPLNSREYEEEIGLFQAGFICQRRYDFVFFRQTGNVRKRRVKVCSL